MNVGLVCVMGLSIVFIGLVCIVLLCKIMSILVAISEKCEGSTEGRAKPVKLPVSGTAAARSPGSTATPDPGPRGEIVAAVSAVIAEELGKDVSAIRILSLKKI